jgi:ABC-2 type transport system ATP-binding protein
VSALAFNRVSFGYRRRRAVLDDLSFEFREGSTLLLGPNGAGKSTMLGLGASALRPDAGGVTMDGIPAAGSTLREFRRRLSWMPQQIKPMPGLSVIPRGPRPARRSAPARPFGR